MYKNNFKSVFDYVFSFVGLLITLPIFILIVVMLYFFNKKSVFFYQQRPGKDGKIFKLIKFKTMTDEKDEAGRLLEDSKRLTSLGKFIRTTSLDEIPQLINIIKGDMSLIGPRPLLVHYIPLYTKEQAKRHNVKPGVTGWAQVNGRNSISWEEKFILDVWYVENISFSLDFKIFILTFLKVFKREGINSGSNVTMSSFKGNK
jgi:undecaprenyl phosphate N,N'-diacetylbacillosamine 1-phosphate transferase